MWSFVHEKQYWNLPKVVETVPVLLQVVVICIFWVDQSLAVLVMSLKLRDSTLQQANGRKSLTCNKEEVVPLE